MMNTEKVNLLKTLFVNGYPDDWDSNPYVEEYFVEVGRLKVDDILKEPSKLQEETASILAQTQDLAISNYKTFIQTAECSHNLFDNFSALDGRLNRLLEDIPNFEESCTNFVENTSGINSDRRLNSLTLNKNAQLLEILELPQLMESFINEKLYEDALELAVYVRRLYGKHPEIPIFKSIVKDVEAAWLNMLHQLLFQLRQDLQLPLCLHTMSHLRRMGVFTEAELRMKFLQARTTWLTSCLRTIPKNDAAQYIIKTIEVTRVNLFSIATQYKAIFNDDDHSPLTTKGENVNYNYIFFSWIRLKIAEFLKVLEDNMDEATPIDQILGQAMYFGLSFSRIGCDFRALMVPIFAKVVSRNFQINVDRATNAFETNMERFTLINKTNPPSLWKSKNYDALQPPESLMEFHPLADYLNRILSAFNELRSCAPVSIVYDVINALQGSLLSLSRAILVFYGQEHQAFNTNAKDTFTRLCMCFADDLYPYIQKCVNVIFAPSYLSTHVGIATHVLEKDEGISLNKFAVLEPIKHLLPVKIEPELDAVDDNQQVSETTMPS